MHRVLLIGMLAFVVACGTAAATGTASGKGSSDGRRCWRG